MTRKVVHAGGDDDVLEFTNTSGSTIAAGTLFKMSHTLAVALVDIPNNGTGNVAVGGIVGPVPKATGSAWVVGEKLLFDVSASNSMAGSGVAAATGDILGGAIAARAAASGDTVGYIKLTPGNTTLTP
jgi:predicted RecA/RadA family phage recombinase